MSSSKQLCDAGRECFHYEYIKILLIILIIKRRNSFPVFWYFLLYHFGDFVLKEVFSDLKNRIVSRIWIIPTFTQSVVIFWFSGFSSFPRVGSGTTALSWPTVHDYPRIFVIDFDTKCSPCKDHQIENCCISIVQFHYSSGSRDRKIRCNVWTSSFA